MKYKELSKKTKLKDGTVLSIQASSTHYSTPREDQGPYSHVEVGFIEDGKGKGVTPPDSWKDYSDGSFPSSVYGYIPIELVQEFCDSHGGIQISV